MERQPSFHWGRAVLTNTCLSSVPLYMLSFLEAPKGVVKRLDYFRARLLWQEQQGRRKYHLVNWPNVCLPKDCGGLGILDLTAMNQSLLCKWLWKLENSVGTCQELLSRSTCRKEPCHNKQKETVVLTSGRVYWESTISSNSILSERLGMVLRLNSGKILAGQGDFGSPIPQVIQDHLLQACDS